MNRAITAAILAVATILAALVGAILAVAEGRGPVALSESAATLAEAGDESSPGQPFSAEPSSGEREMKALALAYPDRIQEVALRDGGWALRMEQSWYYWADGRLLPAELRQSQEQFASYRFYAYDLGLPPIPRLDEESKRRLQQRLQEAEASPPRRYSAFLDQLYHARTRGETEAQLVTARLVGFQVTVHRRIAAAVAAVDVALRQLAEDDPAVKQFLQGLRGLSGYNWREIAGTSSRSYHSYGLAIDLEAKSYGGRQTYWRWALPGNDEWYAIPYEQRWMAPLPVVKAFEQQGFIWGGKWFYFDTMHFEYRPEILVLAREG
jgi:hypothetical protein